MQPEAPRVGSHTVGPDDDDPVYDFLFSCPLVFVAPVVLSAMSSAANNSSTSASQSSSSTGGSSSSSSSSIPQTAAAGGLTITKPPQTATSYYKIAESNTVTFAWNFTSLLSTPTSLTLSALGDNGNTYPVGPSDGKIPGTATSVTWDLWSYQQAHPSLQLAPGTYRLSIWDDRGPGASRAPGLFQENTALQFALYTPQAYTPLESASSSHFLSFVFPAEKASILTACWVRTGWTCPTCNGAWSDYATHPAFVSLTVTFVVMFLSGYSLLRQAMR